MTFVHTGPIVPRITLVVVKENPGWWLFFSPAEKLVRFNSMDASTCNSVPYYHCTIVITHNQVSLCIPGNPATYDCSSTMIVQCLDAAKNRLQQCRQSPPFPRNPISFLKSLIFCPKIKVSKHQNILFTGAESMSGIHSIMMWNSVRGDASRPHTGRPVWKPRAKEDHTNAKEAASCTTNMSLPTKFGSCSSKGYCTSTKLLDVVFQISFNKQ